ncbi:ATP-binding cassette domain-containing protein [Lachnospiraceae bacterium 42-17]
MAVCIDIKKELEEFSIELKIKSSSNRIGILGASGCGKSMTLKMLAGIEPPEKGRIQIGSKVMFDSEKRINVKPKNRNVGYLFQNYALFPAMTVEENIAAGLRGGKEENKRRVREMTERFRLEGLEKRFPGELSGGQQQRTALARIMAYEPEVILLDEPYGALDTFLRDRLEQELLNMLKDYEGTAILVSHSRDEIYRFSEELLIMEEGKAAAFGKSRDIFENPQKIAAARLTGCKNISRVEILDKHHMKAVDFGILLYTKREIPEDTAAVGFWAHEFVPVWGAPQENCIRMQIESRAELPFEWKFYIKPETEEGSGQEESLCWFVQKGKGKELSERGLPDYLKFPEEKLLFLKE